MQAFPGDLLQFDGRVLVYSRCVRAGASRIAVARRHGPPDRRGGVESHPLGHDSVGRAALQDRGDDSRRETKPASTGRAATKCWSRPPMPKVLLSPTRSVASIRATPTTSIRPRVASSRYVPVSSCSASRRCAKRSASPRRWVFRSSSGRRTSDYHRMGF